MAFIEKELQLSHLHLLEILPSGPFIGRQTTACIQSRLRKP